MKRALLPTLVLALSLTSIPLSASAAGTEIQLLLNNKNISFPDAQPYKNGQEYMVPLRPAATALDLELKFNSATKEIQLSNPSLEVAFKAGTNQVVINKDQTVKLNVPTVIKQNRVYVPLSFFEKVLGIQTTYNDAGEQVVKPSNKSADEIVSSLVKQLIDGAYQQLSDEKFDSSIKAAIPVKALQTGWEQTVAAAGSYKQIISIQQNPQETSSKEFNVLIEYSNANIALNVKLNNSDKVISLLLNLVQPAAAIPASLAEEEVVVGANTAYPLQGTLTFPKNVNGPVPAVVLVQGSGPSDRDETVGGYKPFRDLAWGLAEQGIAVLRYDKRTYTYGKSFTPDMLAKFTIKDETIDDAIIATNLLKGDKRINPAQVYIIGHSLGGMMAPRIDADGGNFAGLVILAGSTRPLWEISSDQNDALIQAMDNSNPLKKQSEALVAAERLKAQKLSSLSDAEAGAQVVFGMPGYYLKEMDSHSTKELVSKSVKPIFVLQGEDDIQVNASKELPLWKDALKGNTSAVIKSYPGLNHFFVNYTGKGKLTTEEYNYPGNVDNQVIADIANWINKK
jgi:dienelactone hydrolase